MAYTILIVDDSETTRAVIRKSLSMTSIEIAGIFEAGDGAAALRVLEQSWVDIVFADLNMPGMDGVAMINTMASRRLLDRVPVVIITSDRNQARLQELRTVGAKACISKPFRPETLENVLHDVLGSPGANRVDSVQIGDMRSLGAGDSRRDTLKDAATRVLEDAAFVFTDELPEDEENPLENDRRVVSAVMGVGSSGARVGIVCSLCFAGTVAADLLGAEADAAMPTRKCTDAVGEMLNMIAGMLVRQWFPADADTMLGLPKVELTPYSACALLRGNDAERVVLQTEAEDVIEVWFSDRGPTAPCRR